MTRISAPWTRPLAANHVSNVPPEQQATWDLTRPYTIAGIDVKMANDGYHANAWYAVTGGSSFSVPPFTSAVKATPNNGSDYPIGQVLYGNKGTDEEGWIFDPSVKQWFKDVQSIPGVTGGNANLPPGPGSAAAGDTTAPTQAIEFSVADDGFWVAKTPGASAANKDGNPHPGISIINPGAWEQYAAGLSVREALSLDDYKDKGWLGLDKHFLAFQGGAEVSPAGEELASAMDAAMDGDAGALRALRAVGVQPPKNMGKGFTFGADLGFHF